jgi:hypothetical protein
VTVLWDLGSLVPSSCCAFGQEMTKSWITFWVDTINTSERERVPSLGKEAFLDPCLCELFFLAVVCTTCPQSLATPLSYTLFICIDKHLLDNKIIVQWRISTVLWHYQMHITRKIPKANLTKYYNFIAIRIALRWTECWMLTGEHWEKWRQQDVFSHNGHSLQSNWS